MAWDTRRLESLLTPELRAATPGFGVTFAGSNVVNLASQASGVLQTMTTAFVQDGTQRRYVTVSGANAVVADVQKPSISLTSFDRQRGGLRPHAAWCVANGHGGLGSRASAGQRPLVDTAVAALQRGDFDASLDPQVRAVLQTMGLGGSAGFDWGEALRALRGGGR